MKKLKAIAITKDYRLPLYLLFIIALILCSHLAKAQDAPATFWTQETLTGDWFGKRTEWADKGINFEFVYTADVLANVAGGVDTGTEYLDNIDLNLMLDFERLFKWQGASMTIAGVGNYGGSPSGHAGDAQGVSNIDAENFWRLYMAYFQQSLFDGKLDILAGLFDVNAEFDVIETAGLFLNGSPGMGPDFSASGLNGPSVWPYTSLAGRIKIMPFADKPFYFQTAVFEGTPGDASDPKSNWPQFDSGEGIMIATEMGYLTKELDDEESDKPYGKFAIGNWYYTADFDDISAVDANGDPERHGGNYGMYFLGEYQVYREAADQAQGISTYARFGFTNPDFNQFGYYTGAGVVYTGLIPSRNEDQMGFGMAAVHNSSKFKDAMTAAATPVETSEYNFEFSYRAQITPWFAVQPDMQYIVNPSMDPSLDNAWVMGSRFEIVF